jgi:predicted RNA binding protein YcfA (HicA-like mRNA interferase family)
MSDTLSMKPATLLRELRRLATRRDWSWREEAGKGSHRKIWLNGQRTVVPMHSQDVPPGTFRAILRDLSITLADLED